jgi:hypothetical protein
MTPFDGELIAKFLFIVFATLMVCFKPVASNLTSLSDQNPAVTENAQEINSSSLEVPSFQ